MLTTVAGGVAAAALAPLRAKADGALVRVRAPLVPVIADEAWAIRTVVGLRPFRRNGFALYATRLGGKRVVHNYGHGGGGITLSWGCATLAADLLNDVATRNAAVLGCGVLGLSTARILQERGFDVTIYADAMPPNTTSNIAGGQWAPTAVFRADDVTPAFMTVFQRAAKIAYQRFQLMAGTRYGVRWIDNYDLTTQPDQKGQYATEQAEGVALFADVAQIDPASTPFTAPYVRRFASMLIEPNTYLPALLEDFFIAGGRVRIRRFSHVSEVVALPHDSIVNCTGLGSHELFGDQDIYPIRGQLTILEPQPDVNYIIVAPNLSYMFPRSDGIVVGGTFDAHDWSLEPNPQTVHEKLAALRALYR
ncbi:MAG TPA: FAD-dependent oxidoreductase [Candidatus Tumulicola sp.]